MTGERSGVGGGVTARARLRALPAVHELAASLGDVPASLAARAAREAIDAARRSILADGAPAPAGREALRRDAERRLGLLSRPPLRPVINATGVILHTGLGRAPLAPAAVRALADAAGGYAPVELDMATGGRGDRSTVVVPLLRELTGAESATVVNNTAAALVLTLATLARDREVVASRGELIEIGGSFRLPDIIEAGGARLREVGTTNKTKPDDYIRAIGPETGAVLKMHTSNYRIEGFSAAVGVEALAPIAHDRGVPLVHDIGSGLLAPSEHASIGPGEPDARSSLRDGADLVLFSGDKLLGGPQAGVIAGRAALIERLERHPLKRALRVDKLALAALGVTLQLHRDAPGDLPVTAMARATLDGLRARAHALIDAIGVGRRIPAGAAVIDAAPSVAYLGGGSSPAEALASIAVRVTRRAGSVQALAGRLRRGDPPVLGRVAKGALLLDLRTVAPGDDGRLAGGVARALLTPDHDETGEADGSR